MREGLFWHGRSLTKGWRASREPSKYSHYWLQLEKQVNKTTKANVGKSLPQRERFITVGWKAS